MTPSEEFIAKINSGNIKEAMAIALCQAAELTVTTTITPTSELESQDSPYLSTTINLIEGEITNEIAEELLQNQNYSALYQFHLQQIQQGQKIIFHSLQSLQAIAKLVHQWQEEPQLPEASPKSLPEQSDF